MKYSSLSVAALIALIIVAGCAPAAQAGASGANGSIAATPGADSADHSVPAGAIAPVDPADWAIADRLAEPAYTLDTTAALVAGLARSGIGTYADPASPSPEVAVAGLASPYRLLDFQVHELAVGAWAGSDFSGDDLDSVVPLPPDLAGVPTTAQLLAAYVATADSPGGSLSRALMAGQDLLVPTRLQFPAVVLVLFASDIATDGGLLPAPTPDPSSAAQVGLPMAGVALDLHPAGQRVEPQLAAGICSQTADWISAAIASLFNALKVATPPGGVGRVIGRMWNFLVDIGKAFVQGLLSSVTNLVLGTIRSIAETIAGVAEQIASLLPQAVSVRAAADSGGGGTFKLGPDPIPGSYIASVTSGDLPDWPAVLTDCAKTAKVALPDFHAKSVPLTWGPIEAPANPLLNPTGSNPITDADGHASWAFVTSVDPGDPTGEQRNQLDYLPVAVHRPELDAARLRLSNILLGSIPDLLRPYVAAIFAPYLSGLQSRLNALLDAHGRGVAVIVFHGEASPPPSKAPSPVPSSACGVATGTYSGTVTSTSKETIDIGNANLVGNVLATSEGTGPAAIVIAADGTVGGSWSARTHLLFHEVVMSNGTGIDDLRDEVYDSTGTSISGPACDLSVGFGGISVVTCTDSLKGDCSSEAQRPGGTQQVKIGPPTSVTPSGVTWTWSYTETGGQPSITATFTLSVSRK